jgi:hypothetical protein
MQEDEGNRMVFRVIDERTILELLSGRHEMEQKEKDDTIAKSAEVPIKKSVDGNSLHNEAS